MHSVVLTILCKEKG